MKRIITACLILAFAILALSSCGFGIRYSYADASKYTAGDVKLDVCPKNLDIDWVAGRIKIEYSENGKFEATEMIGSTSKTTNAPMYTWLDGDTLRIKFLNSGREYLESFSKVLRIYIPKDSEFENVTINSVSSDIVILNVTAEKIKTDTVSGSVTLDACSADSAEVESVSGGLHVSGSTLKTVKLANVSGSFTFSRSNLPDNVEFTTVSGSTVIEANENSGFTLEYDTVSGYETIELQMTETDGKKVYGDGKSNIKVSSVSGGIVLLKSVTAEE